MKPRNGHSAIIFNKRFMLVFGGIYEVTKELDDVNLFDIKSEKWFEIQEGNLIGSPRGKSAK